MVTTRAPNRARGFTLVEAIIVIVITGIIGSMVAVFIKTAIDSYFDSVRRAELTDAADVALRRLAREVRLAVPNSLRKTTAACPAPDAAKTCTYIEFVPTKDGGRYRNEGDGSKTATKNFLCTGNVVNPTFDVLGAMPAVAVGDSIVVFNDSSLYDSSSTPTCKTPSNVYCGGSRASVTTVNVASAWLGIGTVFGNGNVICPYANNRFQIVDANIGAVTYACPLDTGLAGTMTRYSNYGFNASQTATLPPGGTAAIVVQNAACYIDYTQNVQERNGLLYIKLTLTSTTGEQIVAFREIHVDNTP